VANVAFSSASCSGVQRPRDLIVGEQRADALHFSESVSATAPICAKVSKTPVVKKEGLQTGQEDIDQVVVQPIVLMGDKGYEIQVPFALGASGQLKNLGFDQHVEGTGENQLRLQERDFRAEHRPAVRLEGAKAVK
jgi:hypothetical protein